MLYLRWGASEPSAQLMSCGWSRWLGCARHRTRAKRRDSMCMRCRCSPPPGQLACRGDDACRVSELVRGAAADTAGAVGATGCERIATSTQHTSRESALSRGGPRTVARPTLARCCTLAALLCSSCSSQANVYCCCCAGRKWRGVTRCGGVSALHSTGTAIYVFLFVSGRLFCASRAGVSPQCVSERQNLRAR